MMEDRAMPRLAPRLTDHPDDAAVSLAYELTAGLREGAGLEEAMAAELAQALTRWMRDRMGGQRLWIPAPDKAKRDKDVIDAFNGRNRDQVCRSFGISVRTFYRILKG